MRKHILKIFIVLEIAVAVILYYMYIRYFIDLISVKCNLEGQFNMGYGAVFAFAFFKTLILNTILLILSKKSKRWAFYLVSWLLFLVLAFTFPFPCP